jgi:hypothetical protein
MLPIIAATLVFAITYGLPNDVTDELARMSHEVASRYFLKSKCLVLLTDDNSDIVDHVHPLDIPVLHVHVPFATMKDSKALPSGLHKRPLSEFFKTVKLQPQI